MRKNIDYDREEFEKCMRGERYHAAFRGRDALIAEAMLLCQEYNRTPADPGTVRKGGKEPGCGAECILWLWFQCGGRR